MPGIFCTVINWLIDPVNLTAISTVVIACFTVILAVVGFIQARLIRKTVDLAREEFIFTHRPILQVKFVHLDAIGDLDSEQGERASATFTVVNSGTSAGTVTGSAVHLEVMGPNNWPAPSSYQLNNLIQPRKFLPGATGECQIFTDLSALYIALPSKNAIRLYGHIVYEDDMGNPRTTYFCRVHDRDSDRMIPTDNPDYDSTD